jgi:2Fe-2S ferredoxin
MIKATIVSRSGERTEICGSVGISLMEVIRNAGIDEMLALCGGCCSCATCHVHVDPAFIHLLPAMTEDECDLLDGAGDRDGTSRLACTIPFDTALNGITVRIARED